MADPHGLCNDDGGEGGDIWGDYGDEGEDEYKVKDADLVKLSNK